MGRIILVSQCFKSRRPALANQRAAQYAVAHVVTQMQHILSYERSLTRTRAVLLSASHLGISHQHYSFERLGYDGGVAEEICWILTVHLLFQILICNSRLFSRRKTVVIVADFLHSLENQLGFRKASPASEHASRRPISCLSLIMLKVTVVRPELRSYRHLT